MKKDETEDKAFGKLVAGKLRAELGSEEAACPDAETLAAYFDRTLTAKERAVCETHLVTCLRCQGQVAELVRLSEADEPPVVVEDEVPATAVSKPGWGLGLVWAAPIFVTLLVVGLWYRRELGLLLHQPHQTALQKSVPAQGPEASSKASAPIAVPASRVKQEARKAAEKETAQPSPLEAAAAKTTSAETRAGAGGLAGAGAAEMATPAERARLAEVTSAASQPTEKAAVADRAEAPGAPAPQPEAAEENKALAEGRRDEALSAKKGLTVLGLTPMFAPKWRVGRRGLIQRAEPGGTWVTVASGVNSDLFDITFATPSTGYAVGHEGIILRTIDQGNTWKPVSSPTSEDLVRVSATSELEARVMTRTGKTFVTHDGGVTWRRVDQP